MPHRFGEIWRSAEDSRPTTAEGGRLIRHQQPVGGLILGSHSPGAALLAPMAEPAEAGRSQLLAALTSGCNLHRLPGMSRPRCDYPRSSRCSRPCGAPLTAEAMTWFVASLGDHDTHLGGNVTDDMVTALCGYSLRLLVSLKGPPSDPLPGGRLQEAADARTPARKRSGLTRRREMRVATACQYSSDRQTSSPHNC